MKNLFSIIILLVSGLSSQAQVQSNCAPPSALLHAYQNDIKDVALYRLYQTKSPDTTLIEIPQAVQDTVAAAFAAVFNLGTQWEADSIFLNYCVHQWPAHPLTPAAISVKVDPAYAWTREWAKGNTTTGYVALDQFMSLHHVYMKQYQYSPNSSDIFNDLAGLVASSPINMKAFQDSLARFPGVRYFSRVNYYGDGDRIYYTMDSNAHLSFWAGWGDCPAGCTGAKNWKYTVSIKDCTVWKDTIVLYADPYESRRLSNCNLAPLAVSTPSIIQLPAFSLSPNPATELLYIHAQNGVGVRYRISDMLGQVLAEGIYHGEPISLRAIPYGLYTCAVSDDHGYAAVMKFVKR